MMSRLPAVVGLSMLSSILLFSSPAAADGSCVITCPANVSLATAPGKDAVAYSWVISTEGTCGGVVQTSGLPSGSSFPVGTTTNSFRALDPPQQSCAFNVTITAAPAAPVAVAPVPTLDEWAMVVMSGLLGIGAYLSLRRRRR